MQKAVNTQGTSGGSVTVALPETVPPTAAEISARNVAYDKAHNPFYHQKRFEIQIHKGDDRQNLYFPRWELVELVLKTIKPGQRNSPDRVIVSDNRDTFSRVLEWDRCWYGYETRIRRGAAIGEEPRFVLEAS